MNKSQEILKFFEDKYKDYLIRNFKKIEKEVIKLINNYPSEKTLKGYPYDHPIVNLSQNRDLLEKAIKLYTKEPSEENSGNLLAQKKKLELTINLINKHGGFDKLKNTKNLENKVINKYIKDYTNYVEGNWNKDLI